MTNNGWMQRVFRPKGPDELRGEDSEQRHAQQHDLLAEVERLRTAASSATEELQRMRAQVAAGEAAQHEANAEIATLRRELATERTKLDEHEGNLRSERNRSDSLGKAATAANRRAEKRLAEADALKKRVAELETRVGSLTNERANLAQNLAQRESDLAATRQQATDADREHSRLREQAAQRETEAKELARRISAAEQELAREKSTAADRDRQLEAVRRENAQQRATLDVASVEAKRRREALLGLVRMSARTLETVSGAALHLARELTHRQRPIVSLPAVTAFPVAVQSVATLLVTLAIADDFAAEPDGAEYRCRFELSGELASDDSSTLGRWVAAYAAAALGSALGRKFCVDALDGGPREFAFQLFER